MASREKMLPILSQKMTPEISSCASIIYSELHCLDILVKCSSGKRPSLEWVPTCPRGPFAPLRLALAEGRYMYRFVYSYILLGKKICLIDAGVSTTSSILQDYVKKLGRSPEGISFVLLTHAHPDHIGGCLAIKKNSPASFGVHAADKPWIEDVQKQYRERPILNFFELMGGSVPVNRDLKDGEVIPWDNERNFRVLETPGHSLGSISFLFEEEGALFPGDAIPAAGAPPIYVNPQASIESIRKLQRVPGLK
jgi:hydroxyacylglutathione hydrolase